MNKAYDKFVESEKEFEEKYCNFELSDGMTISKPQMVKIKSHIRTTILAVLKAEIERLEITMREVNMSMDIEICHIQRDEMGKGYFQGMKRIKANLQDTVDKIEKVEYPKFVGPGSVVRGR